jgi:hypothetical protein
MFYKYPISDVHIHAVSVPFADQTLAMAAELGYERYVMLSAASMTPAFWGNNLLCANIKLRSGGRAYAFAALHYPETGAPSSDDMLAQAVLYRELGFDGIKMMDGKPNVRRRIGLPLNDPAYDPMFSFLEAEDIPLLYHVNDPDEFWTWDLMPKWAKERGTDLFYDSGRYPPKRQIEDEAVAVMDKHPALRIIFPHFFFTSSGMERTKYLFDTYPNMCYDITPGWEMFESFAADYEAWREFFITYSHRILFGTDTISDHWRETVGCLRRVMETGESFTAFEENCRGLALEGEPLRNIYLHNFNRYLPDPPRPVNRKLLKIYAESLDCRIRELPPELAEKARENLNGAAEALNRL